MLQPSHLSSAQCRAFDRCAIEQLGIPGVVLMENAGRNAADLITRWVSPSGTVSIVCGRGNNGGDGFVIARHLTIRGYRVGLALPGDPADLSPDAAVHYTIVERMGLSIRWTGKGSIPEDIQADWQRSTCIVDALLGTGFSGQVRQPLRGAIQAINALNGPLVVAIDVPSGLDADSGEPGGDAVRAHHTITFIASKTGFGLPDAGRYTGQVHVVDIGAPPEVILPRVLAV